MLSRNLEQTLHRALGLANERRHEYATLEHLLLALTDDQDAATVLRACGVDGEKLKRDLTEFLDKDLAGLVTERSGDPKPTAGFQRVVQRAAIHVQSSGRDEVTGANVLVALFSERESHAVYFLQLQDMTRLDAVNFISHGIAKAPGRTQARPVQGTPSPSAGNNAEEGEKEEKPRAARGQDALTNYCVNLNKKAQQGKIDPLIGRDQEIERTIQILCRRTKNNPLYVGDPGVGKTEVAKQLSKTLGIELIRFDMSEYMERHSISRLIGAPPGYVGFDQGGLLTDAIDQHPHAVLLLDEIEKAHQDLYNILLQVMDHGKLTDHNGKTVDFRNVILIMTTNAGAADMAKPAIGFGREARVGEDTDAVNRMFTPEFRNRLDAIVPFSGLTQEIVGQVVEKFVMQLEAQLADRNVTIELSSAAKEWLAEKGYDPLYGARPLARVIQEHVKKPLAEELLFGKLVKGGAVKVALRDGALAFDIAEAAAPALPKPEGGDESEREPEQAEP